MWHLYIDGYREIASFAPVKLAFARAGFASALFITPYPDDSSAIRAFAERELARVMLFHFFVGGTFCCCSKG